MSPITTIGGRRRPRRAITWGGSGGEGGDGYFAGLQALPQFAVGHSLRTQNSVATAIADWGPGAVKWFEFDAADESMRMTFYPSTRADKLPSSTARTPDLPIGLYLPINEKVGPVILTWDVKIPDVWLVQGVGNGRRSGNIGYKGFQVEGEKVGGGNRALWWESRPIFRNEATVGAGNVCWWDQRSYPGMSEAPAASIDSRRTSVEPYLPQGPNATAMYSYGFPHSTWGRAIQYWQLNLDQTHFPEWEAQIGQSLAPGLYHKISMWFYIGNTRYHLYDRVCFSRVRIIGTGEILDGLDRLYVEFDTSTEHTGSTGTVRVTGSDGVTVPTNAVFHRSDGLEYKTTQSGVIGAVTPGEIALNARAQTVSPIHHGVVGNCAQGTTFTFEAPPAGVNATCTAATAFTGGADFFSDEVWMNFRNFAVIKGLTLPADPTTNTTIFKSPVEAA